jgi:peptidoglycan/xylan/chitin deacetylase (PgdA/CDA1 family)
MRSKMIAFLEAIAGAISLSFYPILLKRKHINFFYHAVSDKPMNHARHLYPVVPVSEFERALLYLQHRYQFVAYSNIHAHRVEGRDLPDKAVHLSFDDGYSECFSIVRPMLFDHSISCTFFVTTDWIDNQIMFYRNKVSLCIEHLLGNPNDVALLDEIAPDVGSVEAVVKWLKELGPSDEAVIDNVCRLIGVDWRSFLEENQPYLTTSQIKQMHVEGFTIGAHSTSHRKLVTLTEPEIEEEIVESCRKVHEITGQKIVPFSFPNSAFGLDRGLLFSIRVRYPFVGLLFDTKGVRKDENFIVNRVWAERPLTSERKLHPLYEVLHNAYQEAWVDTVMDMMRKLKR